MTAQAPERCNGTRILSYINWEPFAPATHKACPGCPDCQPKPSEGTVSERDLRELHNELGALPFIGIESMSHRSRLAVEELLAARATIERQARDYAAALESIRAEMVDAERKHAERISNLEADLAAARLNERRYLWLRTPFGIRGGHFVVVSVIDGKLGSVEFNEEKLDWELDAAIAAGDGK